MRAESKSSDAAGGLPWATYALTLLCLGIQIGTQVTAESVSEASAAELAEARSYLERHPYLKPGPGLAPSVDEGDLANAHEEWRASRVRLGLPAMPQRVQRREQRKLDALVEEAMVRIEPAASERYALRAGEPSAYFTHGVFHTSWLHLGICVGMLLLLGFQLERAWGAVAFAGFSVLAMVVSGAIYVFTNPGTADGLIGLQGLIAAMIGAFAIRFGSTWTDPTYWFFLACATVAIALPELLGLDWFRIPGVAGPPGGVAICLVGAAGLGALVAAVGRLLVPGEESARTRPEAKAAPRGRLDRAEAARKEGRLPEAQALLTALLREHPDDREALLMLWDVCLGLDQVDDAADAMLRVVREEVRAGAGDAAVEHWFELQSRELDSRAEPALLIRISPLLRERDNWNEAVAALQQALARSDPSNISVVAARVARAAADLDSSTARDAAWRALGCTDLDLDERQAMEQILGEIEPASVAPATTLDAHIADAESRGREAPQQESWVDEELAPEDTFARVRAIDIDVALRELRVLEAIPLELDTEAVVIELSGGRKKRLFYPKIEVISVVAVDGLAPEAVIVVDLILNWSATSDEPLKAIRLRADRFDATHFASGADSSLDAVRRLLSDLLQRTGAIPLPDEASVRGLPFAAFSDLGSYQRDILSAEEPGDSDSSS